MEPVPFFKSRVQVPSWIHNKRSKWSGYKRKSSCQVNRHRKEREKNRKHTNFAAGVLDVELEDTLDLLDLGLALSLGEGLELIFDLGEELGGLETFNLDGYRKSKVGRLELAIGLRKDGTGRGS